MPCGLQGVAMKKYQNLTLDEERALYGCYDAEIDHCLFAGPADGESALKECGRLKVTNCDFHLRYPFWHVQTAEIEHCTMTETCRAALWYDSDVTLRNCEMGGIKAVRECDRTYLEGCNIISPEFGWFCRDLKMKDCTLRSEYPFLQTNQIELENFTLTGKYSFQYVTDAVIKNSNLDTKDAFWHSKNVTVIDCVVKGEYLAWYSENLHLIRCKIIGTQPLCYCKGLVIEDCEMIDCDLSFEKSEVTATVKGSIDSVKNPRSGCIQADAIGEVILEEDQAGDCKIICNH